MDRSFLGQSFQVQCSIIEKMSILIYLVKKSVIHGALVTELETFTCCNERFRVKKGFLYASQFSIHFNLDPQQ